MSLSPAQAAADAQAVLAVLEPDVLWSVLNHVDTAVIGATYPQVIVAADVDPDWDEDLDGSDTELDNAHLLLVCPRCAAVNSICQVDMSVRWNDLDDELTLDDDGTLTVAVLSADPDHRNLTVMCTACIMPVDLPDWLNTSWG